LQIVRIIETIRNKNGLPADWQRFGRTAGLEAQIKIPADFAAARDEIRSRNGEKS
jgi:hypothetical protein